MTQKTIKPKSIAAKARQVLDFAERQAQTSGDGIVLFMAIYGVHGQATLLFPTETERAAFSRTKECKRIDALFDTLPRPPVKEVDVVPEGANGTISLRLPRAVHSALLAEARAEGVSLDQLCLSKLVAQLRSVV